jgi:hypothetical protein
VVFSEYFIITLIIKVKVTVELLDYKVIIKLKVVKIIKLVISLLKLTSIITKTIVLINSKLIKFS